MGAIAVAGVIPLAGCGSSETGDADSPRPNVLLVTIDTLRADRLGCYGYFRDTSPHLDALARESFVFENCQAPVAQTLPSHTSLFTGLYPREHGVAANVNLIEGSYVLPPGITPVAVALAEEGYHTAAFVSAEPVKGESGLSAGFRTWHEPEASEVRAHRTVDLAADWIERGPEEPFFLWVHLFDPHHEYKPPPPYDEAFATDEELESYLAQRAAALPRNPEGRAEYLGYHNAYDGEIRWTDAALGRLLDAARAQDWWERTAAIVTSDHGESLGQHYKLAHGHIWREQLHVPLLMRIPGRGPERISTPLAMHDVLPTFFGRVGMSPRAFLEQCTGTDVLDASYRPRPLYAQLPANRAEPVQAVTVGPWRLIEGLEGGDRLFHLEEDPHELRDVAAEHPERVDELRGILRRLVREQLAVRERYGSGEKRAVSARRLKNLEALGYVDAEGSGAASGGTSGPPPDGASE